MIDRSLNPASIWILLRYQQLESELQENLQTYALSHSIDALYHFLWDSYADWYVEYLKTDASQTPFAKELFSQFVITLSPYLPFETEALWQEFFGQSTPLALTKKDLDWTKNQLKNVNTASSLEFESVISFVKNLRSLRGLFAIDPVDYLIVYSDSDILLKYQDFVRLVGRVEVQNATADGLYEVRVSPDFAYNIDILSFIKDRKKEIERTKKIVQNLEKQMQSLDKQLSNPQFLTSASAEIIQEKKDQLQARKQEKLEQEKKLQFLIEKENS